MPKKQNHKAVADGVKVYCNHDELLSVTKLIPHPKNPNKHPEEQIELLAKIIQKNGWRDRIVISNRSGMIVKGHGRYQAAIRAGLSKVPVEYQNYNSDADEIKDLIADNKIAELSEVDDKAAFELVSELREDDFDFELAGFKLEDFEKEWGSTTGGKGGASISSEIEFSEELTEYSNYIVLVFDNDIDWLQAQSLLSLKTVKSLDSREGYESKGVGRVLRWPDAIKRINET